MVGMPLSGGHCTQLHAQGESIAGRNAFVLGLLAISLLVSQERRRAVTRFKAVTELRPLFRQDRLPKNLTHMHGEYNFG